MIYFADTEISIIRNLRYLFRDTEFITMISLKRPIEPNLYFQMRQIRNHSPWLTSALIFVGSVFFCIEIAKGQDPITNFPLYYSLGGLKATSSPASIDSSLDWLRTKSNLTSAVCGGFNPSFDIQDMLSNQLNDSLASLAAFPQTVQRSAWTNTLPRQTRYVSASPALRGSSRKKVGYFG